MRKGGIMGASHWIDISPIEDRGSAKAISKLEVSMLDKAFKRETRDPARRGA